MAIPVIRNLLLGVGAFLVAPHAVGQTVQVSRSSRACASFVHVVAKDALFSEVLRRLSTALDFRLQFEAAADPRVSVDASRRPLDLIQALAPQANVSVSQVPDAKCPGQLRIAKVSVLPSGKAAPAATASRPGKASLEYRPQGPGSYDGADRAHNPD